MGRDPGATIDEVFEAWAKVHAVIRALCIQGAADLTPTLEGNLNHVNLHAEAIERLLRS